MDFHSLTRKELQSLCKLNKIPANATNVAMADALKSLEIVEGVEEFLNPSDPKVAGSSIESPQKIEVASPKVPRTTARTSTRPKTKKVELEIQPTTARTTRRGGAKADDLNTPAVSTGRKKATAATSSKLNMESQLNEAAPEIQPTAARTACSGAKADDLNTPAVSTGRRKATAATASKRNMERQLNECEEKAVAVVGGQDLKSVTDSSTAVLETQSQRKGAARTSTRGATLKKEEGTRPRAYSTRRSSRLTKQKPAAKSVSAIESKEPVKTDSFLDELNVTDAGDSLQVSDNTGAGSVEISDELNVSKNLDGPAKEENGQELALETAANVQASGEEKVVCGELADDHSIPKSEEISNPCEEANVEEIPNSKESAAKNGELDGLKPESDGTSHHCEDVEEKSALEAEKSGSTNMVNEGTENQSEPLTEKIAAAVGVDVDEQEIAIEVEAPIGETAVGDSDPNVIEVQDSGKIHGVEVDCEDPIEIAPVNDVLSVENEKPNEQEPSTEVETPVEETAVDKNLSDITEKAPDSVELDCEIEKTAVVHNSSEVTEKVQDSVVTHGVELDCDVEAPVEETAADGNDSNITDKVKVQDSVETHRVETLNDAFSTDIEESKEQEPSTEVEETAVDDNNPNTIEEVQDSVKPHGVEFECEDSTTVEAVNDAFIGAENTVGGIEKSNEQELKSPVEEAAVELDCEDSESPPRLPAQYANNTLSKTPKSALVSDDKENMGGSERKRDKTDLSLRQLKKQLKAELDCEGSIVFEPDHPTKTPMSAKSKTLVSDDKENVGSERKLPPAAAAADREKGGKGENKRRLTAAAASEVSLRQLKKQLKALSLKTNEDGGTKAAVKTRPALQALCENQLAAGETKN